MNFLGLLVGAAVFELADLKADRHDRRRCVVLNESRVLARGALVDMLVLVSVITVMMFATKMVSDLVEVRDAPQAVGRVVRQADVEETAIFLGDELVHITATRPDEQQVVAVNELLRMLFGRNFGFSFDQFIVLVVGKLIVAVFGVDLVKLLVLQGAEHELEVDRHVRVVVQRHDSALLDEEHDKTIVVISLDGHTIQISSEVVRIRLAVDAGNTQLVQVDAVHALDEAAGRWITKLMIKEVDAVARFARLNAHILNLLDECLHLQSDQFVR